MGGRDKTYSVRDPYLVFTIYLPSANRTDYTRHGPIWQEDAVHEHWQRLRRVRRLP